MHSDIINQLKNLDFFKGIPVHILSHIATQAVVRNLETNDILGRRGDASDSMFIIRDGWIKIVFYGPSDEEVLLNQLGPGEIIGEMGLVDRQPRSGTMIALGPVDLVEIKYEAILASIRQYPDLALNFLRALINRLRFANAYIEATIEWSQHIAAGNYSFVEDQIANPPYGTVPDIAQSNEDRAAAFLMTFFKMVRDIQHREAQLKQKVQELTIQIDETKRQRAVSELTSTDFFADLQATAEQLRRRRRHLSESSTGETSDSAGSHAD